MADQTTEAIRRWLQLPANNDERAAGQLVLHLPGYDPGEPENTVVVTRRGTQTGNVVSKSVLDRFPAESWTEYKISKPRVTDSIELVLEHQDSGSTLNIWFEVVDQEEHDIILGKEAIENIKLDGGWVNESGQLWAIRGSKAKQVENTPDSTSAAATTEDDKAAEREKEKLAEKPRRRARNQTGSSTSAGSVDSAGSANSTTSRPSTN